MDLGLRLGEGSSAAIALHLIRLACRLPREMATFDEARRLAQGRPVDGPDAGATVST